MPLTVLARKYGASKGYALDTFLPESIARYAFWIFGVLLAIGLGVFVLRALRQLDARSALWIS